MRTALMRIFGAWQGCFIVSVFPMFCIASHVGSMSPPFNIHDIKRQIKVYDLYRRTFYSEYEQQGYLS